MKEAASRNITFDVFKGIACIAVVFMHIEFPGTTGIVVQCVTRWSVPFFFAVSGYFFRRETVDECVRKGKHIAGLTLFGVVFFVIVNTLQHYLLGDLRQFILKELTLRNLIALIAINKVFYGAGVLWFLFSLLYVYAAYAVMIRFRLTGFNRVLCIGLWIMHFLLAYGPRILHMDVYTTLFRNWLFEGLPCFLLGKEVYQYVLKNDALNIKRGVVPLIVGGLVLSLVERWLLGRDYSVHIGSVAVLIGLLFLASTSCVGNGAVWLTLSKIGRDYSLWVYIFHMAVYKALSGLAGLLNVNKSAVFLWTAPIITVVVSLLLAALVNRIKNRRPKESVA